MRKDAAVTIVEVGPRDGFQGIGPIIPTLLKIELVSRLHAAGVRRMEATAFVNERALPQMADAAEVLAAARALPGLGVQVLVPNARHAERALTAGAEHLTFVVSVSEKHNMNNVRKTPADSVEEYRHIVSILAAGTKVRLDLATAFDCPFDGATPAEATLALLDELIQVKPDVEVALCDTTGRVTPDAVARLFAATKARHKLEHVSWAFHGHDTFGLGVANALAAYDGGIRVFDSSFAGLGGCPFAPGATGNVATEDLVWTFERMGISTSINLEALIDVAEAGAAVPGAPSGGRVRMALRGAGLRGAGGAA